METYIYLLCAVEYIEANLQSPLYVEDVAAAVHLSPSHLHKLFARVFGRSVHEYILQRRLCAAARELIRTDRSITDISLDFQYSNAESFSRTFKRQFLRSPSLYRKESKFYNLHPKMLPYLQPHKEGNIMTRKYDLTELGEKILASKGTYVIYADIDNLMTINNTMSHEAGDAALAETAARFERSISPDMSFFRIGNDDFVLLTGNDDLSAAESIAQSILSYADDEVNWSGGSFRFSVSLGISKIPNDYSDVFAALRDADKALHQAKISGRNQYIIG